MDINNVEYSKVLIQRDIDERLTIPQVWMVILGLVFMNNNKEAQVRAVDWGGRFWEFRCSIRSKGTYDKPVFQVREWKKFVRYAHLQVGDKIILQQNHNNPQFIGDIISFRITAQRMGGDGLWANVELPQHAAPQLLHLF